MGSALVARSAADGYTLILVSSSSHAIAPALQDDLPYHPIKDFAPISLVATGPNVLVVPSSIAANSVKELVALAKSKPGLLNYASPGLGSVGHMAAELFKSVTGANIVHVPYKGAGAGIVGLLSGDVQVMFSGPGSIMSYVTARRLNALAVASPKRATGLENVPTFSEAGFPAVEAAQWYGVLTTAGTPQAIVEKLNREVVRIMQLPDVRERFLASGYDPTSTTPQQFAQLIRNDLTRWQKVAKGAGIKMN